MTLSTRFRLNPEDKRRFKPPPFEFTETEEPEVEPPEEEPEPEPELPTSAAPVSRRPLSARLSEQYEALERDRPVLPKRRPDITRGAYETDGQIHKPSRLSQAIGIATTGLAGYGGGMGAAASAERGYFDRPFAEAMGEYEAGEKQHAGRREEARQSVAAALQQEREDRAERTLTATEQYRRDMSANRNTIEARRATDAATRRAYTEARTDKLKKDPADKLIDKATVEHQGKPKRAYTYQRPDGTRYTVIGEDTVYQKPTRRPGELSKSQEDRMTVRKATNRAYLKIYAEAIKDPNPERKARDMVAAASGELESAGVDVMELTTRLRAALRDPDILPTPAPKKPTTTPPATTNWGSGVQAFIDRHIKSTPPAK